MLVVVPDLACSSAFSLPQCPEWAAIHLSSSVLLVPRRLRALRQLMTALLLVLSAVRAWIDDRLSVQMMMCLLLYVASLLQVSVIAVSSAWKLSSSWGVCVILHV